VFFLINTGWSSGPYGVGERIAIALTRKMITAALSGELNQVAYKKHTIFNLQMPRSCLGVPADILDPAETWDNNDDYNVQAKNLAGLFKKNFRKFDNAPESVKSAGPQ